MVNSIVVVYDVGENDEDEQYYGYFDTPAEAAEQFTAYARTLPQLPTNVYICQIVERLAIYEYEDIPGPRSGEGSTDSVRGGVQGPRESLSQEPQAPPVGSSVREDPPQPNRPTRKPRSMTSEERVEEPIRKSRRDPGDYP